jgi:hypothetical protein
MPYVKGDRVQDGTGLVGTVAKVYDLAGVDVVEVYWNPSAFRADDPHLHHFIKADEDAVFAAYLRHRRHVRFVRLGLLFVAAAASFPFFAATEFPVLLEIALGGITNSCMIVLGILIERYG